MLGHPVPFVYIHALNMTQSQRLLDKRVGYLCTSMFLNDDHELLLLLLNSVRKDLDSSNILEVSAALSCMSWLLNRDTVSAILPLIIDASKSPNELVRKKAVILLLRCLQKDLASTWDEIENVLRARLCDTSPSVMGVTLHCFFYVLNLKQGDPITYSFLPTLADLVPSFVGILKQLVEKRLPSHMAYHNIHAPWIQISILRLLRYIGMSEPSSITHMAQVLKLILTTPADKMVACAIVNEAIQTICALGSAVDRTLLDLSARNITLFLGATSQDLNYLGLTLLAKLVTINPVYATEHQAHVISCLESPDDSIRRKTIELLFHMTNPRNMPVIVSKMLERLRKSATDSYLRAELVIKIATLAEKFSADNLWFVTTMNNVFLTAGDQVPTQIANKFMRYIADGSSGEDEKVDLRLHAVNSYIQLSSEPQLSDIMQMTMAWVLGEYGYLIEDPQEAMNALTDMLDRPAASRQQGSGTLRAPQFVDVTTSTTYSFLANETFASYYGSEVKQWIVSALIKLVASTGTFPDHVRDALKALTVSDNLELARRCQTMVLLVDSVRSSDSLSGTPSGAPIPSIDLLIPDSHTPSTSASKNRSRLQEIFPVNSFCEEVVPSQLLRTKLDAFVKTALEKGARPYSKPAAEKSYLQTKALKEDKALRWKAYDRPVEPSRAQMAHTMQQQSNPALAQGVFSSQAYNPLVTNVPSKGSAPGSPLATTNPGAAPRLQTTQPLSLAALGAKSGPWSSSGFAGARSPATPPPQSASPNGTFSPPHLSTMPAGSSSGPSRHDTTSPPAATTRPRPELDTYKPRLDAQQTRLANALFSGVGDAPGSGTPAILATTGPRTSSARKQAGSTPKQPSNPISPHGSVAPSAEGTAVGNLLDFPSESTPTHSHANVDLLGGSSDYTSLSPTSNPQIDLLGMEAPNIGSNSSHSSTPHMTPSGSLLEGLSIARSDSPSFHMSPSSSFSQAGDVRSQIGQASSSASPAPVLDVMSFTDPSSTGTVNGGQLQQLTADKDNWNLSNFAQSPLLSAYLESQPKPSPLSQVLCNDPFLAVSTIKAWTSKGVNVGILFGNRTSLKIDKVKTVLQITPPLRTEVQVDTTTNSNHLNDETFEFSVDHISPHAASVTVCLLHIDEKPSLNMSLFGTTSFEVHGQPKTVKFRIPVDLRDLIRPSPSLSSQSDVINDVSQFGALWTSSEVREARAKSGAVTASAFATTSELATQLSKTQNIGIIQAGKAELVAVCYLVCASSSSPRAILLHAKLDTTAKNIEWTFKSASQSLAEIAARHFSAAFP